MSRWGVRFDDDIIDMVNEGAVEGLQDCIEDLREKSEKLCPKDRGYNGGLVSTAQVEVDPETLTATMRYTADHALYQHEGIRYRHKPGEQAKFLEQPLNENARRYLEMCATRIRRRLNR